MTWFDQLEPSVQAALIVSAVTLLGIVVNFLSNLVNHSFNLAAKRHEQLLNRRVESINEIVLKLEELVKQSNTYLYKTAFLHNEVVRIFELKGADDSLLKEVELGASSLKRDAAGNSAEMYSWFETDMFRLTAWLKRRHKVRSRLAKLQTEHLWAAERLEVHLGPDVYDIWEIRELFLDPNTRADTLQGLKDRAKVISTDTQSLASSTTKETKAVSELLINLLR